MRILIPASIVVASLAFGCNGKQPSTPPQATATASATAAPTAEPAAELPAVWKDDLTKEEKLAIMKKRVTPALAKVFHAQDPAAAEFNCKSCHGPDMKDPQEFLPRLTMKDGKMTSFADKPDASKFMMDKVVPEMATALGLKPYDPQTKEGFGCAGCHAVDMK